MGEKRTKKDIARGRCGYTLQDANSKDKAYFADFRSGNSTYERSLVTRIGSL
ncbi:hypothetical protein GGP80_001173 [Salinibacter ruber]|nr:hypothetical protein [Salinibacter ruber]MCS4043234.1 hypothetical protein [Salinibacter ruber]